MALPLAAMAIGGVLGGAAGFLGGSKGKKASYDPYGTLNPEQRAIVKSLGPRLQTLSNQGPQYYTGDLSAEMTPEEEGFYGPQRSALLSGALDTTLQEAQDPVARAGIFRSEVSDPAYQMFRENALPGILENYSSFSTAAGNRVAQEYRNLTADLLGRKFAYDQAAKERGLSAIGQVPALQQYYATPRSIRQAGLDRKYNEYVRAGEESRANIDKALNFLGISTGTYTPGTPDTRWSGMLSGMLAGAQLGGSFGGGAATATRASSANPYSMSAGRMALLGY